MLRRAALLTGAAGLLAAASLAAQATNPPYLAQFPTVARVKQAMTASDPREQALKQLGALWQLEEIIKQLSGRREFRGFLPDEQKLLGDYMTAEYQTAKAIDSAFPGPYGNWRSVSQNTPYRYMRTDNRFGIEGIRTFTLLPAAVVDEFLRSVGADQARWAARAKADSEAMIAAQNAANNPGGARTDPETVQIRRCVEAGRSETQCMMEGLGKSFMGLVTAAMPGLQPVLRPARITGIRMSGDYRTEGFSLSFYSDGVTVGCAPLVSESHEYSAAVAPGGIRITIASAPAPIVLTLRSDGRLAGPGPTQITGQVQVGTEYGTRTWSDGRTEPISRPVYATQTHRCNAGLLAAAGAASPLGSIKTAPATMLNMVFGGVDQNPQKPVPVGARMSGEYGTQLALDLDFEPEGVVLGCRDAASLRSYTVLPQGNVAVIRVENGAAPIDFTLSSDGKINGSGSVKVDGRVVTGTTGNGALSYAPRSATCTAGTLAPAGPQLSEAEKGAAAARAELGLKPAGPPAAPAAGASGAPASGAGPAFVQIESGFPTEGSGAQPLAGMTVMLLDVGLDAVLREADVLMPPGRGYKSAFTETYDAGGEKRSKLLRVLASHTLSYFQLDKDGIGKTPELTIGGTNGFLATATVGGTKYMWALSGVARAGWTKVVLSANNALRN